MIEQIIGVGPVGVLKGRDDFMVVVESEEQVLSVVPDMILLEDLPSRGLIVTSVGKRAISCLGASSQAWRGSGNRFGVHGDDSYWAKELGKVSMIAYQRSKRGGVLHCEFAGDRVLIGGSSIRYWMEGFICEFDCYSVKL